MPLNGMESSERAQEGLGEVMKVHEFLKEQGAVGILIGGKAVDIVMGATAQKIENHKDTDALVINGGESIGHNTQYDLFLPKQGRSHQNRNKYALGYHVHYVGDEPLDPGLYIPPAEVVFLTEDEMRNRRVIDRLLPGVIEHRQEGEQVTHGLNQLNLDDLVVELPGDISWLGDAILSLPAMQVVPRNIEHAGNRTFISFKTRSEAEIPETAFPDSRDVRSPVVNYIDILPDVETTAEDEVRIAKECIKTGSRLFGIEGLIEYDPRLADDIIFLELILADSSKNPLECAEAFACWMKAALENQFNSILPLFEKFGNEDSTLFRRITFNGSDPSEGLKRSLKELASKILEQHGIGGDIGRITRKVECFEMPSMFPCDENGIPVNYKDVLKDFMLNFSISTEDGGRTVRKLPLASGASLEFKGGINKTVFSDEYCGLMKELGITDEEIEQAVCAGFKTKNIFTAHQMDYQLKRAKMHHKDDRTIREVLNDNEVDLLGAFCEILDEKPDKSDDTDDDGFDYIKRAIPTDATKEIQCTQLTEELLESAVSICGFESHQELQDALEERGYGDNERFKELKGLLEGD